MSAIHHRKTQRPSHIARPTTLIVVEPNPELRRLTVERLTDAGYFVSASLEDNRQVRGALYQHKPDAFVLAVNEPGIETLTLTDELLRKRVAPVLLLTTGHNPDLARQAARIGASALLQAPVDSGTLTATLEVSIHRWKEARRLERQTHQLTQALNARDLLSDAKRELMQRLGIGETEAYSRIRRQAMDSRQSLKEIAQAILTSQRVAVG